ncbi:MAG: FAD/NAD(P)-binding oxidoreductase [Pseudomonadota bacterium]
MGKEILVIGGGQAAASFAARIRQHDADSKITILSEEPHLPYQRPPLSKKYATGEMQRDQLLLRPENWYSDNGIKFREDVMVSRIDPEAKTATTSSGEEIRWDKLMLTTGSSPRSLPDAVGGSLEGVYLLRSIQDADQFATELIKGNRVAIIGGGYIGLEAAAVCAARGLEVTLIEAAPRILQRVACPETSRWFKTLHEQKGVKIHEDTGLSRIDENQGKATSVVLAGGSEIEVDFVLVGIGIVPNAELASGAGLDVEGGILVNEYCQTSHPDIYAAGDCAAFQYRGELSRLESVQNAIDQAECAADNIAGQTRIYEPYPWFWSDQYDVKLQIAGLNRGYDTVVVRPGEREGAMSHFYFNGNQMLAVDCMNDPRTYMVSKKMLEAGKNITPQQAADLELQLKSLM